VSIMKEDANDKLTSSSYSGTGTAVGSSVGMLMVINAIFSLGNGITVYTPAPTPPAVAGLEMGLGLRTIIDLFSSLWSSHAQSNGQVRKYHCSSKKNKQHNKMEKRLKNR